MPLSAEDAAFSDHPFAPSGSGDLGVERDLPALPVHPVRGLVDDAGQAGRRIDGSDYRFVDERYFERARAAGDLAEWALVHGQLYGTPRAEVDTALADGYHVLLDVDVQGGTSLMKAYPGAVSIFLLPPSFGAMEARLKGRGTEDDAAISGRLSKRSTSWSAFHSTQYVIVKSRRSTRRGGLLALIHARSIAETRRETGGRMDVHFPRASRAAPAESRHT